MISTIYKPSGRAAEYSPFALNIYGGCPHQCAYCYCRALGQGGAKPATIRPKLLVDLEKFCSKYTGEKDWVHLCFSCDPYGHCAEDAENTQTRGALEILLRYGWPVQILSKAGEGVLKHIDFFKKFGEKIKVGQSLTFTYFEDSTKWEPGAAHPGRRMIALQELHRCGIKTWASFEPVIDPAQTLSLIHKSLPYLDGVKIGKWNHDRRANAINWPEFVSRCLEILDGYRGKVLFKVDLLAAAPGVAVPEEWRKP